MPFSFAEACQFLLLSFFGGPLLAEIVGPLWHYAKHLGWLGETFQRQHIVHHLEHYPPQRIVASDHEARYLIAGEWNMYVLAGLVLGGLFLFLPFMHAFPMALGAGLHGLATDYAHRAFHLKRNRLDRFQWYRTRARLHRIHHRAWGNFGVLFFWFDRIFGLFRDRGPSTPDELFPGYNQARS